MIKEHNHIIQKQCIEIGFTDLDDTLGIQNRIAELFYEKIQPGMQSLFDELLDKDHIISIDQLTIDCGILSKKNWEEEWVDITLRKLKEELATAHTKEKKITDKEDDLFFFLEHGHLTWNSRVNSLAAMEGNIVLNELFILSIRKIISSSPVAAKRLANSFSDSFVKKIIQMLLNERNDEWKIIIEICSQLEKYPIRKWLIDEALLYTFSLPEEHIDKTVQIFLSRIYQETDEVNRPVIERFVALKNIVVKKGEIPITYTLTKKNKDDGIYITNAGLIIVHPFLIHFFEKLEFIKDGQWKDKTFQHAAMQVLEYLVNGSDELFEFNLPLPKILCGLDIEEVLTEKLFISNEIKAACEELLKEIIKHWEKLKNTGIQSLRETFLQRNGKLTKTDNGWLLQVERKGMDILLNSLPWGIGIIKLPWMKTLLYTEW